LPPRKLYWKESWNHRQFFKSWVRKIQYDDQNHLHLLYQINFIRMKLDFFKILCTTIRLMSWFTLCVEVRIFDKWLCNIQLFFFTFSSQIADIGRPRIWPFFEVTRFIKELDYSLHGRSWNGCVFTTKNFVKNLPNFIVRSLTITLFTSEKRYSLSFWNMSHRRWKIIRMNTLWGKIFQTVWKIF